MNTYKVTSPITLKDTQTKVVIADAKKKLKHTRRELGALQDTIYAHGKYAILICIQGMDTAGKDSLIREVFKDFNVRGVEVHSFKVPTELELKHDYLWRHYIALPARGKFGVFNRTHYENVLVTRVHPGYIMGENIPGIDSVNAIDDVFWEKRFEQINNFEKHVAENGTLIFKFFLNLSKDEQKFRLLRRLNKKEKNWKFSAGDLKERKLWDDYQKCYEEAINKTSKPHAPWYTIPADDKPSARLIVAQILLDALKQYDDIKEPELDDETKANLNLYKAQLEGE
ncbi:PPK2 family polyphosphate kinase [Hyunsoonleella pacifica]|uniref:Polyphosphate kinase 2 family protein n=1 Tax=Hyunsoonleella pacifica TaxID=1080224 RepID=A0A4Q9FXK4_9FLAO|nr:PPK2 family polyphosphate kinase [Hyunsoonleella pacifica]TBN19012.1 polyphosphate kinase 2 family protein [Hyunsoonleella pacifica]GGD06624.1 polyphosphate kinase [Hyunsoonleella pacifica]